MAEQKEDKWSSEAYQHSASFVPKLATKVVQWLHVQKDDVILDVGCGGESLTSTHFIVPLDDELDCSTKLQTDNQVDGILDVEFGKVLSQGKGSLHGIDASPGMISAAKKAVSAAGLSNCEFEVLDATKITTSSTPTLHTPTFTKAFSNAALHWILRPPGSHIPVFTAIRDALLPGGTFALEMGGLGNVAEMRTAIVMAVARRVGMEKAVAVDPWFFPDEEWLKTVLEKEVGGWEVLKVEREWRPTTADKGGVEGWVRLMGKELLDAVPEEGGQREEAVREIVEVLRHVCRIPGDGEMISYVRLRCLARKL
ncbi:methyltransferase domain-containing protein [Colletotrichum acutatum]|uniref:Methyltransferase domain-containing protein n=1 Tax=Glomerella acutata TaxID=27357 RepID=A0AAD8UM57_GLOAC|nr:methyltransferase domain-containing protein [Colletotrichum acutatum]KAK1726857.1 methyltransferase domain-containing protein [Colletotrichum acutatum]